MDDLRKDQEHHPFALAISLFAVVLVCKFYFKIRRQWHRSPPVFPSQEVDNTEFQYYDVFISFKGDDTCKMFSGHLHDALKARGISTFSDDSKPTGGGEEISDELLRRLEMAKIFVPIFSKQYAESKCCLRKVTKMVESGISMLPVLIDVEPSNLRNQTGPFEVVFNCKNCKETNEWRNALNHVGEMQACYVLDREATNSETKLKQIIIKRISYELNRNTCDKIEHPVGIDDRLWDVVELLDMEQDDVRMIQILGIGGTGKTTLAKAVFSQISSNFQFSSFISNVKEAIDQDGGLLSLQKRLITEITKDTNVHLLDITYGGKWIKELLCKKPTLLVLDDVDDTEQLNALARCEGWFGPWSRIIVTTKDRDILKESRWRSRQKIYRVGHFNEEQSLEIFSYYAFAESDPPKEYKKLSKEIVATSSGLPLILEVFGSFLYGKDCLQEWETVLEEMREHQERGIGERLRISFDGLDEREKQVFLDIACFYIGKNREEAFYMWKECSFAPHASVQTLLHRSLIKINGQNEFEMHDELRNMGREIVQQQGLFNPSQRSRIWDIDEAASVLEIPEGMENREGVLRCDLTEENLSTNGTASSLRLLQLDHFYFQDKELLASRKSPNSLHAGWWRFISQSFPSFNLAEIVVLKLSHGPFSELHCNERFHRLKVLDLSYCRHLTKTPDFASFPGLAKLVLQDCESLSGVDESIGCLTDLVSLNLRGCRSLVKLPGSICHLSSLEFLNLKRCSKISALRKGLRNLTSLRVLLLDDTGIKRFPDSVPHLRQLSKLSLSCSSLDFMPNSIGNLESLQELDLHHTPLKTIPDSIGQLSRLKNLFLNRCKSLEELPGSMGRMKALKELILDDCDTLRSVPEPIGYLQKLCEFSLSGCKSVVELPNSIGGLISLEILNLDGCKKLKKIPKSIGNLKNLRKLLLRYCDSLEKLPSSIGMLESLKELLLDGCPMKQIPSSIGGLKKLNELSLQQCPLEDLPDTIGGLESLQNIVLIDRNIRIIPDSIGCLGSLRFLTVVSSVFIEEIPETIGNLKGLIELNLDFSHGITCIPDGIGQMTNLKQLSLRGCCSLQMLPESIGNLCRLEELLLNDCESLKAIPQLPSSLLHLYAYHCAALESISDVSNLIALRLMNLSDCTRLVDIPGLEYLKSLRDLVLINLPLCGNHLMERLSRATYERLEFLNISGSWAHEGDLLLGYPKMPTRKRRITCEFSLSKVSTDASLCVQVIADSGIVFKIKQDDERTQDTSTFYFGTDDEIHKHLGEGGKIIKVLNTKDECQLKDYHFTMVDYSLYSGVVP